MSSHLPMALSALAGLDADAEVLQRFYDSYSKRLRCGQRAAPATTVPAAADWRAARGRFDAFEALRHRFAAMIERDGRDAALRSTLAALTEGVAGAAFHGLIRTAHAVESQHDGELAAALAYWCARWRSLPAPQVPVTAIDGVEEWLSAIGNVWRREDTGRRSTAGSIVERLHDATATRAYRRLAGALQVPAVAPGALLSELSVVAARRYAHTRDFTVLHLATGARALQVLLPWLPPGGGAAASAFSAWWPAVAAAWISTLPDTSSPGAARDGAALSWAQVKDRALGSDDDHVIKLVHAMSMQQSVSPRSEWLAAATTAVRGLTPPGAEPAAPAPGAGSGVGA